MKKKSSEDLDDDLRPHYDFDFSKMKPNRFAGMRKFRFFGGGSPLCHSRHAQRGREAVPQANST